MHAGDFLAKNSFVALGCVVKKEKVRCVLNASGPPGQSINDDVVDSGVQFPRLRDAGEAMQRGDWLWKGDISDYYLNFPLRPDMFPFVMVEIGFVVTAFIYVAALMLILWPKLTAGRAVLSLVAAAGLSLGTFLLFTKVFSILLPASDLIEGMFR